MVSSKLGLICTTIAADTCDEMADKTTRAFELGTDVVELRVDKLNTRPTAETIISRLGSFGSKSVLTVRPEDQGGAFWADEEERLKLVSALTAGIKPAYLDVELETARRHQAWLKALTRAPSGGPRTIVSWHDFLETPDLEVLRVARREAKEFGDMVKIVTTAKSAEDNIRVLTLYKEDARGLIAFCMGSEGTASRILSLQLGSPMVYASLPGEPVAPGQLSVVTLKALKTMIGDRQESRA